MKQHLDLFTLIPGTEMLLGTQAGADYGKN